MAQLTRDDKDNPNIWLLVDEYADDPGEPIEPRDLCYKEISRQPRVLCFAGKHCGSDTYVESGQNIVIIAKSSETIGSDFA
jgi:hypothetical protein